MYFGTDKFGNPKPSVPGRIATMTQPGNPRGQTFLKKIIEFDKYNTGPKLTDEVKQLSQVRTWGPLEDQKVSNIARALRMNGVTVNAVRAAGRILIRLQGPTGAMLRGAGAHYMTADASNSP